MDAAGDVGRQAAGVQAGRARTAAAGQQLRPQRAAHTQLHPERRHRLLDRRLEQRPMRRRSQEGPDCGASQRV